MGVFRVAAGALFGLITLATFLPAQTSPGVLRGKVTDPSGAVVTKANVSAVSADGKAITGTTDDQGVYEIRGLAPGNYTVSVAAKGFAVYTEPNVAITAGQALQFDIALEI